MARFELRTDGEMVDSDVNMVEFFEVNDIGPEVAGEIIALRPGEEYVDGGGAAPVWSLQRVA